MKKIQIILLLGLLSCESTTLDLITPDSISVGTSTGTMNGFGLGNKTMRNQETPLELDFNGESEATMVWLEWDLPAWTKEPALNNVSIIDIEKAIEARIPEIVEVEVEVPVLIPPAETVDVEEVKEELKRELSPIFIAGFFAFLGLLGGVFLVSKIRR